MPEANKRIKSVQTKTGRSASQPAKRSFEKTNGT